MKKKPINLRVLNSFIANNDLGLKGLWMNFCRDIADINNKNGFSVFETMIALGLSSIIGAAVMNQIVDAKKQEQMNSANIDFEVQQLLNFQQSKSNEFWQAKINEHPQKEELKKCFNNRGANCQSFVSTNWIPALNKNCDLQNCDVKSEIYYKFECNSSTKCSGLQVNAETVQYGHSTSSSRISGGSSSSTNTDSTSLQILRQNQQRSFITAESFAGLTKLVQDTSCTGSSTSGDPVVVSMNINHSKYHCKTITTAQRCLAGTLPLKQMESIHTTQNPECQIPISKNCASVGIGGSGFLGNQTNCNRVPGSEDIVPQGHVVIGESPGAPGPGRYEIPVSTLKIRGFCGQAHGSVTSSYPLNRLCTSGEHVTIDSIGADGSFNWSCRGVGGALNATCLALKN